MRNFLVRRVCLVLALAYSLGEATLAAVSLGSTPQDCANTLSGGTCTLTNAVAAGHVLVVEGLAAGSCSGALAIQDVTNTATLTNETTNTANLCVLGAAELVSGSAVASIKNTSASQTLRLFVYDLAGALFSSIQAASTNCTTCTTATTTALLSTVAANGAVLVFSQAASGAIPTLTSSAGALTTDLNPAQIAAHLFNSSAAASVTGTTSIGSSDTLGIGVIAINPSAAPANPVRVFPQAIGWWVRRCLGLA